MALEKGEKPLKPAKVLGDSVAAISQSARLLVFPLAELKSMAKGRGLIIQDIAAKDELAGVAVGTQAFVVAGTGRGGKQVQWKAAGKDVESFRASRARKGQPIAAKLKPTGISIA